MSVRTNSESSHGRNMPCADPWELFMCTCVSVCTWHMCLGAWGSQKKTGDPLRLGHCELSSMGADLTRVISKRSMCSSLLCSLPSPGDFKLCLCVALHIVGIFLLHFDILGTRYKAKKVAFSTLKRVNSFWAFVFQLTDHSNVEEVGYLCVWNYSTHTDTLFLIRRNTTLRVYQSQERGILLQNMEQLY